jgi:hypothetical protein
MYSNQTLLVVVKNPLFFERYLLDFQTGQATLSPDVASGIVQALLPSLAKLGEFASKSYVPSGHPVGPCADEKISTVPKDGEVDGTVSAFQVCLSDLSKSAIDLYKRLEPFVAPDSLSQGPMPGALTLPDLQTIQKSIDDYVSSEFAVSSRITIIATQRKTSPDTQAVTQLISLQKVSDAVASDLSAYSQRITDLKNFKNGTQECTAFIDSTPAELAQAKEDKKNNKITPPIMCVELSSRQDNGDIYRKMVTRTITYSLNTFIVANSQDAVPDPSKKKLMATVQINFADTKASVTSSFRLEASAGAFFSTLPIRSFSVRPIFTSGVITDKVIAQNVLHPTVVPFAAANYRLTNDLPWGRWKSNIYLTGAVGINPNTVSADFATGLSYSWRALMISAMAHFGHDVSLTQGLQVGQSLGASFNGSLPTQTHWTTSFALGLSIRIPSLVGR